MFTYNILAGTTDVSVVIRIIDSIDGTPETGVVFNTAGIDLEYRRELAASVDITEATLAALTTVHADGGFLHIGNGYYRLDLPDAACASGATGVLVHGTVTGMIVIGCYINLTPVPVDLRQLLGTAIANPTVAGVLEVDVTHHLGTAVATPTVAGVPEVDMTHLVGVAQSATDLKDFADDGYDPSTNKVQGVVLTDTVTTYTGNTVQTGDSFARLGAPAGASVSADIAAIEAQTDDIGAAGAGLTALATQASVNALPTAAAIADAVLDEDMTAHQTQGSLGQAIGDPVADTNTLYKAVVTDAAGATVGVDVVAVKAETTAILDDTDDIGVAGAGLTAINLPDQTMNITGDITGNITGNLSGSVGSVTALTAGGIADAVLDEDMTAHQTQGTLGQAIGDPVADADTIWGLLNTNLNDTITSRASQTSVNTVDDFLDTEIAAIKAKTDLIPGTIDGKTFSEIVTLVAAVLVGKASGLGTLTAVFRAIDDSKDRVTATVDTSGNRSAVVLDAT